MVRDGHGSGRPTGRVGSGLKKVTRVQLWKVEDQCAFPSGDLHGAMPSKIFEIDVVQMLFWACFYAHLNV